MPKLRWIEIQGFRAFGASPQRLDFATNLAVITAPNSQGKTSLSEAFEFLLTGQTSRRELMGGARAEYTECLRNVHIPPSTGVYVAAGIEDDAGEVHNARRVLTTDYTPQNECTSILFVDNVPTKDMSSLGVVLSEAPLRAPVLMNHTLRWMLSAGPQNRADYFKAILEVQDLEHVRDEIDRLLSAPVLNPDMTAVLAGIAQAERIPSFANTASRLRSVRPNAEAIQSLLHDGLGRVLSGAGRSTVPDTFFDRLETIRALASEQRQEQFPLAELGPTPTPTALAEFSYAPLIDYNKAAVDWSRESETLTRLIQAILDIPAIASTTEAIDCPVCLSASALTPQRLTDLRLTIEGNETFAEVRRLAAAAIKTLLDNVELGARGWARSPKAAEWTEAQRLDVRQRAASLVITSANAFDDTMLMLDAMRELSTAVVASAGELIAAVGAASECVASGKPTDVESLLQLGDRYRRTATSAEKARADYAEAVRRLDAGIRLEVDRLSQTSSWKALMQLCENPLSLADSLANQRSAALVRIQISRALEVIDLAKTSVLDAKFAAMSNEISRWWELLRPEETVAFGGVRRRGTGRRFLDFTAALYPKWERPEKGGFVERHAVAVFSDSQLNCLGMSTFLARCCRQNSPFVLLDDPVPASDEEHQATFVRSVIEELLNVGKQVIVTTHDEKMSKRLEDYYVHLPLDGFAFAIEEPGIGPVVLKKSDELGGMLAAAQPFIKNQSAEIRKLASHRLRDAAERLCKEIAVKKRKQNAETASIADYSGFNLGQLVPEALPFLTLDASHTGKMKVLGSLLNPGSHDAPPPSASALGVAFGDIKKFKSDYLS